MAIYKRGRGFELGTTENKSSKWPERDSNPGPPDCKSDALTTRPRCLPMKDGFEEIEHEFPFSTFRSRNRTTCSDVPLPLEIFHLNDPKNLVTPIY